MAPEKPDRDAEPENDGRPGEGGDLESRRKSLDAALAARQTPKGGSERDRKDERRDRFRPMRSSCRASSSPACLSVLASGDLIDRFAGTSPWGLIVFLLLGFVAGVLNVLRSAGLVAEPDAEGYGPGDKPGDDEK